MTCANLFFKHDGSDIAISTNYLEVQLQSTVYICIQNGSSYASTVSFALYWAGLKRNRTLDPPTMICGPTSFPAAPVYSVPGNNSIRIPFNWTPSAAVTPDPAHGNLIVLFAQIVAEPVDSAGEDSCNGWWNADDFDATKSYNTDQSFPFSVVPFNSLPLGRAGLPPGLAAPLARRSKARRPSRPPARTD
jgi:hypothetical protein